MRSSCFIASCTQVSSSNSSSNLILLRVVVVSELSFEILQKFYIFRIFQMLLPCLMFESPIFLISRDLEELDYDNPNIQNRMLSAVDITLLVRSITILAI